ncbi:HAD-IB family hydrolase [Parvibium lacunae]|uniref:HAD-IB family hydrolase n=1 Tax=Parvibium lacunae TaxID=1888893 RepID=A0A368KZ79_9BURK|nr:HAD-IB family hydrolase [Parvibium lacunae]RCS56675.1 HAD-IB family hydrolase [Parvibium lacunae]
MISPPRSTKHTLATAPSLQDASVTVAAFDFDGTLIDRDSLWHFLRHCCSTGQLLRAFFLASPYLLAWQLRLGRDSNSRAKAQLLKHAFHALSPAALRERGAAFVPQLDHWLRPAMRERLAWHRAAGHHLVLVSASLDVYLAPWAQQQGFAACLSSQLAHTDSGHWHGHFVTGNCYGPEKARRLSGYLAQQFGVANSHGKAPYLLYAYGDTRGDREMLAMADIAYYQGKLHTQHTTI